MAAAKGAVAPMPMVEIKIIVRKAQHLAVKDHIMGVIPKSSDPYVEVRLMPRGPCNIGDDSVEYLGKTEIVMGSVNPEWGEVFTTKVARHLITEDAQFYLSLYDYDKDSKHDPMGVVKIPLLVSYKVTPENHNSHIETEWYNVEQTANKEEAKGQVQCTIKLTETIEQIPINNDAMAENLYIIKLKLIKGSGLAAKDSFMGIKTSSDPYAIVKLFPKDKDKKGILLGKTEYLPQTVNPKWREVFSTRIPIDEIDKKTAKFEITIMDYDDKSEDDPMGVVTVPLLPVLKRISPNHPLEETNEWYSVPEDSCGNGEKAKGKIQCHLTVNLLMSGGKPS